MKKEYKTPDIKLERFSVIDVITASGGGGGVYEDPSDPNKLQSADHYIGGVSSVGFEW